MSWKTIWQSLKNNDMRKRILAVIGMLVIFRVLAHIPIPLSDGATLKQVLESLFTSADTPQLLSFFDVLSGGALANFSIMLVGLSPYINASIIMQLLTRAIPKLEALNKEGEYGRKKINQYTRLIALPLAIIQSVGMIFIVRQTAMQLGGLGDITAGADIGQWILMVASLTGGAMLLMWLGELITEEGIGNGISLVITVGILSQLPQTVLGIVNSVFADGESWTVLGQTLPVSREGALIALGSVAFVLVLTVLVVKLNEAARNLTIHYAKRVQGNRAYGGVTTKMPIKLITAGVIPIIFAQVFLSVPLFVGQLLSSSGSPKWAELSQNLVLWFQPPSAETMMLGGIHVWIYPLAIFVLVFIFTFFYTSVTFNTTEIADNLQKQGGFIEGVRSGAQTEKYLGKIVNRLTLFGAISLGALAASPYIIQIVGAKNGLNIGVNLDGTGMLILVAVALETLRQIESRALMVTYDQYDQPDFFYETSTEEGVQAKKRSLNFLKRNREK